MAISSTPTHPLPKSLAAKEQPLVSVVIPVYNVERYIEEAVNSVIKQSYTALEIIIVDDESPDQSIALVERTFNDPRIQFIRQKNRGLAGARNTGIRHATGAFIAFLDSDDFWQHDKIEKHMALMQITQNCGLSFSSSQFVDANSKPLKRIQAPKKKANYQAKDIFCRNPIGNGSVPVIRKSILNQIIFYTPDKTENGEPYTQYFHESLRQSEDIDCWTRIAILTGTDFHYIDEPLTNYRLISTSLSADVDTQFKTWLALLDNLKKIAPEFEQKYGPVAKTFQYRYLARRSLFQGQATNALRFMFLALKTRPFSLFYELKKTIETLGAALVLSLLPEKIQAKLINRFLKV